jgi:hypothetical protein
VLWKREVHYLVYRLAVFGDQNNVDDVVYEMTRLPIILYARKLAQDDSKKFVCESTEIPSKVLRSSKSLSHVMITPAGPTDSQLQKHIVFETIYNE